VIIVGRGGGSLEDLWAFNEEVVARAIHRSAIPVVSAVGHETDFTISDFTADVRAATPSAAAELVIAPKADFEEMLGTLASRLAGAVQTRALESRNRLLHASHTPSLRDPRTIVERPRRRVEQVSATLGRLTTGSLQAQRVSLERRLSRMARLLDGSARDAQRRVDELGPRLPRLLENAAMRGERGLRALESGLLPPLKLRLQSARDAVRRLEAKLGALNPQAVLERGFSITLGPDGKALTDPQGLESGDELTSRLARGSVKSRVSQSP
jgi:exodeoxyribonuclease VII large subunit